MKRARQASRETSSSRHVPARHEAEPGGADPSSSPDAASKKASAAKPEDRGSQHVDGPTKTSALPSPNVGSEEAEGAEEEEEEEDGLRTIDRLLEEGLGLGRKCSREPETATATEAKLAGNRPGAAEHRESKRGGGRVVLRKMRLVPFDLRAYVVVMLAARVLVRRFIADVIIKVNKRQRYPTGENGITGFEIVEVLSAYPTTEPHGPTICAQQRKMMASRSPRPYSRSRDGTELKPQPRLALFRF